MALFAPRAASEEHTARNGVAGAPLSLQRLRGADDTNDGADRIPAAAPARPPLPAGYPASVITAAPTVALVASSIRIREPVSRLRV